MKELLRRYIKDKKVLILGFGREGRSTFRLLQYFFPSLKMAIADRNPGLPLTEVENEKVSELFLGKDYLNALGWADIVFKSPGINLGKSIDSSIKQKIVSQTSLFLEKYSTQTIGITGTKGKSTTASLTYHILKEAGKEVVLVGNIGIPPFDLLQNISRKSTIIFEISAHQLEYINHSPHIAVLLNIFQEHLDYFSSMDDYSSAKFNIAKYQQTNDFLIFDNSNLIIKKLLSDYKYNGQKIAIQLSDKIYDARNQTIHIAGLQEPICVKNSLLHGRHNLKNIIITASILSKAGLQAKDIERGLPTFKPLEHRLEDLGVVADIRFINDSISTIPESTIEAIHTLLDVDTIILGGHDRGVNYNKLVNLLADSAIRNLIFMGGAGERMMRLFAKKNRPTKNLFFVNRMSETEKIIVDYTQKDKICLLSPAAASYDQFNNFEERGRAFKAMINSIKEKHELPDKDNP